MQQTSSSVLYEPTWEMGPLPGRVSKLSCLRTQYQYSRAFEKHDMRWCQVNALLDHLPSAFVQQEVPPSSLRWRARRALGGAIGSESGVVGKLLMYRRSICVSYR